MSISEHIPKHSWFDRLPSLTLALVLLALAMLGAACGPAEPAVTPTPTRTPRPTFTPTSEADVFATQTAEVLALATPTQQPTDTLAATDTPIPTDTPLPETPTPVPTDTPAPSARLTVSINTANVRRGPGTSFPTAGQVNQGQSFDILGKNEAGSWWQIENNGQLVWIADSVVQAENPQLVALAPNIPTPLPAPTRPPATSTPVPPPTAPPAAADPCATIGGDGCKFRVRGGPAFASNGGQELKLTFAFIHSGRGNEAQGSYFVWLEKEGVGKLPVPDGVRSWTGDKRQGPNGSYNYEYKLGLGPVGGTVAGCYFGWVLDGNGERDSQNFRFCVPEGQGEVWIEFDQG